MGNSSASAAPARGGTSALMDDMQKIAHHMARLNVPGLPRNYELFHEAIIGQNGELARDIAALGPNPHQISLDELGLKYRLVSHCGVAAERSQTEAVQMLRDISEQLATGLTRKQAFVRSMENVAHSLAEDQDQGLATFVAEMDFLNSAIAGLVLAEAELAETLSDGAEKLNMIEKGVAAVRAATLRNRLTGLPNRIALTDRLTALYGRAEGAAGSALVLASVDDFEQLSGRYGAQATNRILRKLAALFRRSIKKNDFVAHIGDDEFAFLFGSTGIQDALAIGERLRSAVEDNIVFATSDKADPGRLTISLGIASGADAPTATRLQANGEAALSAAKADRRTPIKIFSR
ncbi:MULTISPECIES: GGDEF domain-containing protein [unclassified Sinorhizobium]|uniref:GGDEF domain-containing protein n=1 Tax=unclassified Sinorhizobium TaxID=2613772 RepID=UPI003525D557